VRKNVPINSARPACNALPLSASLTTMCPHHST